ncbi:hypothetical protein CMR03_03855 [Pantoea allii]|nr:hypothetical protein CMR03_03855 [Pantoea allii]
MRCAVGFYTWYLAHKQVKSDVTNSTARKKAVFSLKDHDDRRLIAFVYFIDNERLLDVGPENL